MAVIHGEVASFDEAAGLGIIRGDDHADYPFHCTQILDGSRTIPPGTAVTFEVLAGHLGRWEAAGIRRG